MNKNSPIDRPKKGWKPSPDEALATIEGNDKHAALPQVGFEPSPDPQTDFQMVRVSGQVTAAKRS